MTLRKQNEEMVRSLHLSEQINAEKEREREILPDIKDKYSFLFRLENFP